MGKFFWKKEKEWFCCYWCLLDVGALWCQDGEVSPGHRFCSSGWPSGVKTVKFPLAIVFAHQVGPLVSRRWSFPLAIVFVQAIFYDIYGYLLLWPLDLIAKSLTCSGTPMSIGSTMKGVRCSNVELIEWELAFKWFFLKHTCNILIWGWGSNSSTLKKKGVINF